ncbi:hypothetical protein [Enterococcus hirae]|uniref:hypothetical protein n=1 Tax=Enterococcus hirae TaxID=1354 RepID=UPI0032E3C705
MPYETELQRHLDIFALSLSLKKNNRWSPEDDKVNYPLLFSIYLNCQIKLDKSSILT